MQSNRFSGLYGIHWPILIGFLFLHPAWGVDSISILANPGPFGSIESAGISEEKVNWWDEDKSDDDACTESFAALELQKFLRSGGIPPETPINLVPIEKGIPSTGSVILIGTPSSNALLGRYASQGTESQTTETCAESYRIHSSREGGQFITIIQGDDRVGCLYGVYDYLEHLGFRFFGLGEQGTVFPSRPVVLPEKLDIRTKPAFQSRGFWAWEDRGDEDFLLWMARNRLNYWTAAQHNPHFCKKIGLKLVIGGHAPYKLFIDPDGPYPFNHPKFNGDDEKPKDPYVSSSTGEYKGDTDGNGQLSNFEAHPDWYGLLKGERQREMDENFGACNICTSNADGADFLARNFVKSLIDGDWKYVDIVNFWALDARPWCECEHCARIGSPTNRLLLLVHQVQKVMKEAQSAGRLSRQVLLHTCAYHETLNPPDRPLPPDFDYNTIAVTLYPIGRTYTHAFGDPASTEINQPMAQHFLDWMRGKHYHGDVCIGEYYNVSRLRILPVVYSHIMAADIPWFHRYGVRHFQYMHTPTRNWGTWTINQRLMAQLLWNPTTNVDAFLADYFEKFYPTTSQQTRTFYEHLERGLSNIKALKHYVELPEGQEKSYSLSNRLNAISNDLFPLKSLQYEESHPITDDGLDVVEMMSEIELARNALDQALLDCAHPIERKRLIEDEKRFAYGEAMMHLFNHLIRASMFHHQKVPELARIEVAKARIYAENLRNMVEVVQGAGAHASDVNGFEATQLKEAYEFLTREYGDSSKDQPFLGAWIHINALFKADDPQEKKEESIAKSIENCRRSGLHTVIPYALTSSGVACYPSGIVPEKEYGDWDPLGVIIREARARDLKVHISVPVLVCGHEEPRGILKQHPEWALRNQDGKPIGYISGANPEAQQWIVSVIKEIMNLYKPDGIMLDYLRFPNKPVDVDPQSRKCFLEESRLSDYDIKEHSEGPWQKFKEACLIDLAGMIRKGVDEVNPDTEIGLYTWGPDVVRNHPVSQDWVTMAERGYLNLINISGYVYKNNYGDDFLKDFEERLSKSVALAPKGKPGFRLAFVLGVITSHGKIESADEIEAYLHHARLAGIDGVSVFTLTYLEPFLNDLLRTGPFDVPR